MILDDAQPSIAADSLIDSRADAEILAQKTRAPPAAPLEATRIWNIFLFGKSFKKTFGISSQNQRHEDVGKTLSLPLRHCQSPDFLR